MHYNVDSRFCLESKLHEDRVCRAVFSVIYSDWRKTAASQMVVRTNFLICNMVGSVPPNPLPVFQQSWQWCFEAEGFVPMNFSAGFVLWAAEGDVSHRSTIAIAFTAAYSLACDSLGRCSEMHSVKQNAMIHQDKFKSDTLLSFYYPWMWAPRGAMLIFPLSGMIIQKVFIAE